jgi:hypothetical protein
VQDLASSNDMLPTIAQSLCNIFIRSPNIEFISNGKKLFEVRKARAETVFTSFDHSLTIQRLKQNNELAVDTLWDSLLTIKTFKGAPLLTVEEIEEQRAIVKSLIETFEPPTSEQEFKDAVCEAMTRLYTRKIKPTKKDQKVKQAPEVFLCEMKTISLMFVVCLASVP